MREEQYKMQLKQWEEEENRRRNVAAQQFRATNLGKILDSLNPQQRAVAEYSLANMQGDFEAPESGSRITKLLEQFGGQHSPQPTATMQEFAAFIPPEEHTDLYRKKVVKPNASMTMIGGQPVEEPMKVSDLEKIQIPVYDDKGNVVRWDQPPPWTTPSMLKTMGGRIREKGDVSGGDAGKTASLTYAQQRQGELNDLIYNKDGKIRSSVVRAAWASSKAPLLAPLTSRLMTGMDKQAAEDGQRAWGLVDQNTQAVLRTETGAAMGQGEIDNILARYLPGPLDSEQLMAQKFQDLQNVTSLMVQMLDPNSEFMKRTANMDPLQRAEVLKADLGLESTAAPPAAAGGPKQPMSFDEFRKAKREGRLP
jgi:hypothetical protein